MSKKRNKWKHKGKEKAHTTHTTDEEDEDTDVDIDSHVVKFEKCLMTSQVNLSDYTQCDGRSFTPQGESSKTESNTYLASTTQRPVIIIDSGTSSHIHANKEDFNSYNKSSTGSINGFGNGRRTIQGRGEAHLLAQLPSGGCSRLKLQNPCFVPNSSPTLVSVPRLDQADCYTLFGGGRCVTFEKRDDGKLLQDIISRKKIILTGTMGPDRLYHLDTPRRHEHSYSTTYVPKSKLEQLHCSLGHLNYQTIISMIRKGTVEGVKISKRELNTPPSMCTSCAIGKAERAKFPPSSGHAKDVLGLVHSDLWGPAPVQSVSGHRYIITFTDDKSRWVWVYFLKRKSEAFAAFKEWLVYVEKETGKQLRNFRSDGGGEFISNAWIQFMKDRGIRFERSSPDTPEQNGRAERQNRTIFDRVRTILIDANLPLFLWAAAVAYIVYTKNRHATRALTNTTPYEVRYGSKPDISKLYPFGCKAYVYDHSPKRKKLSPRAFEGIFIGYAETQKAYRVYLPKKRTTICSIHVKCDVNSNMSNSFQAEGEIQFVYDSLKSTFQKSSQDLSLNDILESAPSTSNPISKTNSSAPSAPELPPAPPEQPARCPRQPRPLPPPREPSTRIVKPTAKTIDNPEMKSLMKGTRPHQANTVPFPSGPEDTEVEPETSSDPGGVTEEENANPSEAANIASGEEPKTHKQAMESPDFAEWEEAEQYELEMINRLGTYKLVKLPKDRKAVGSKWVYKVKRDNLGNIAKFRARIVAQGFSQTPGVDYSETFAPVAKIESIRLLLAISATLDWEVHIIDVDSAFLNSDLPPDQEVFLAQPPGYVVEGKEDHVWLLLKGLYGLKQAGHLWYQKLKGILFEIGFHACKSDPCIFIRSSPKAISIISSHVDDLGLYSNSKSEIQLVKSQIAKHVSIKDLGEICTILGMEVIRNRKERTISLSHRRYIDELVKEYGQEHAKGVSSPMEMGTRLTKADCPKTAEEIAEMRNRPYQNAVGSCNHTAVFARPDIAKAVQTVAQFSSNPGKRHWNAVMRIIRYLKQTRDWVLTLGGKDQKAEFTGYCDADFANSPDHGRSISGYAMMLGGCFSWSSKKQSATALSTGEAEYYAATHAGREVLWLRQLMSEIGFAPTSGTTLCIDNTSSIRMIDTPDQITNRTKHINVSHHWIREEMQRQTIFPEYIPSDKNVSDIFTKGLHGPRHKELCRLLGMGPRTDAN